MPLSIHVVHLHHVLHDWVSLVLDLNAIFGKQIIFRFFKLVITNYVFIISRMCTYWNGVQNALAITMWSLHLALCFVYTFFFTHRNASLSRHSPILRARPSSYKKRPHVATKILTISKYEHIPQMISTSSWTIDQMQFANAPSFHSKENGWLMVRYACLD